MNGLELMVHCARQAADLPEGWVGMIFKSIGPLGNWQGVMVRGAVCPAKTRGPDKGEPNWSKRDRRTECEVFVSQGAYRAAIKALASKSVNAEMGEGR